MESDRLSQLVELWHEKHKKWILRAIADRVLGDTAGYNKSYQKHIILRLLQGDRVTPELQLESLIHLLQWRTGMLTFPKQQEKKRSRWQIRFPHFVLVGKGGRPKSILHSSWAKKK